MRIIVVLVASLLLAGCSFFGIYNRADDYLGAEESQPTQLPDGSLIASVDRYQIPEIGREINKPETIEAPAPLPLIEEAEQDSASLSAYRSEGLNARLEHDGAGALVMHLDGNFAALWAAVTDAVAASTLKLTDLNRSTGTWYLEIEERLDHEKRGWWSRLWRKDKVVISTYMLKLSRTRTGGYLSLLKDADTLANEELNQSVLEELQQKLAK